MSEDDDSFFGYSGLFVRQRKKGHRDNMTNKEYKLHAAYFSAAYRKYFEGKKNQNIWWAMVVGWANVIEKRYMNFKRQDFLDEVRNLTRTKFLDNLKVD